MYGRCILSGVHRHRHHHHHQRASSLPSFHSGITRCLASALMLTGDQCTFASCDEGYSMSQSGVTATCQADGTWSATAPTCTGACVSMCVSVSECVCVCVCSPLLPDMLVSFLFNLLTALHLESK